MKYAIPEAKKTSIDGVNNRLDTSEENTIVNLET